MTERTDKALDFVLRYYEAGKIDTQRALRMVEERTGLRRARIAIMRRRIAVAAGLLLLLVGGGVYYYNTRMGQVLLSATEQATRYTLPDQTCVVLRPGSTLQYRKNRPRTVVLSGDAYFEVARDEHHPFTISNALSRIRVLGTRFVVSNTGGQQPSTSVYVAEGKVLFTARDATEGMILSRGMKARLRQGDSRPQPIEAGSANQTAWATGLFHFDNTPLTDVLRDLSDFYHTRLSANAPEKRLSGDFATDSLPEIVSLIEETLGVEVIFEERGARSDFRGAGSGERGVRIQ